MRSIGSPPMPPLALISSTAISIETLAACPHSAPLPVSDTWQPIFTLRPASLAPCPCAGGATTARPMATVSQVAKGPARFIGHSLGKLYLSDATASVFRWRASYRLSGRLRSSLAKLRRATAEVGALHLRRIEQAGAGSGEHN